MWCLTVNIYEKDVGDKYPVVGHNFYGATQAEAKHYFDSHMKTDSFLRGCVQKSQWKDVSCRVEASWTRLR